MQLEGGHTVRGSSSPVLPPMVGLFIWDVFHCNGSFLYHDICYIDGGRWNTCHSCKLLVD